MNNLVFVEIALIPFSILSFLSIIPMVISAVVSIGFQVVIYLLMLLEPYFTYLLSLTWPLITGVFTHMRNEWPIISAIMFVLFIVTVILKVPWIRNAVIFVFW